MPDSRLLFIVLLASAAPCVASSQVRPQEPFVIRDVCPYECCRLGTWVSQGSISVMTLPRSTASVAFTLRRGDTVAALRGDLRISRLGRAVLRRPLTPAFGDSIFRPSIGDTVYIASLSGESGWYVWHNGKLFDDIRGFWDDRLPLASSYAAELISPPEGFWWVELRSTSERRGWVPAGRVLIYGIDSVSPGFSGPDACSG